MTEQEERTRIAAGLLQCKPEDVQPAVRVMNRNERADLTNRIDGVLEWVADYELAELHINGRVS